METRAPARERDKIPGCTCQRPAYLIRGNGGQGYEPVGNDLRSALRILAKRNTQYADGEFMPQSKITFETFARQWLAGLERKETTRLNYTAAVEFAIAQFGDKPARKVTVTDISRLNEALKEKPGPKGRKLSPSTRARYLRILSACFSSAVAHGHAAQNPVKRLPAGEKPRPGRREADYFEKGEIPVLLRELPEGLWRSLFLTAFRTGLRSGELVALRWLDVDLVNGILHVRRTCTAGHLSTPKSHEVREVELTPDAVDVLATWKGVEELHPEALVFPRPFEGGFLSQWTVLHRLYKAMDDAGLPWPGPTGQGRNVHSTRHTYAALALEGGASMYWLSVQLGHSSVVVTARVYAHIERRVRKEQAAKLAAAGAFEFVG